MRSTMFWIATTFVNFFLVVRALPFSYESYKVYTIKSSCETDLNALVVLLDDPYIDFWSPLKMSRPIFVMVHPKAQPDFELYLRKNNLHFNLFMEDVDMAVEEEKILLAASNNLNYTTIYERFGKISSYLSKLEKTYTTVKLKSVGKSVQKLKSKVCQISTDRNAKKPVIFVVAGVYGREWFSVALAKYLIRELVENKMNVKFLEKVDWHVLPVMNPDGYEHAHVQERFWKKNRSYHNDSCVGVDLNRNFNFHWGEVTGSSQPCSEVYMGHQPFSEPESRNVMEYLQKLKGRVKMFLGLHGHGTVISYPWAYTKRSPIDGSKLQLLGEEASTAMADCGCGNYRVESAVSPVAPAGGTMEDWAKGKRGVEYVYTISLPPGDYGYDPDSHKIHSFVKCIFQGIKLLGQHAADNSINKKKFKQVARFGIIN